MASDTRLTIVQHAGDFREAAQRLAAGGGETYGAQRYTVDHVAGLAARIAAVTTVVAMTEEAHDVVLPGGARAIGAGFRDRVDPRSLVRLVAGTRPDRLILRTPSRPLIRWAIRRQVPTMLLLADSMNDRSPKARLGKWLLARLCRHPVIEVVANHGTRAAAQLVAAGVPAAKVTAWDYPAFRSPADAPPKVRAAGGGRILFVGMLIADKGVDEVVDAVRLLADGGIDARADLVGQGDAGRLRALAAERGVADRIALPGLVPHDRIVPMMAAADIVVVPSRHAYSEGLPLTITEALCARTPLVLSDHPMFVGNLTDGESALFFPAGDAAALAERVARLLRDDALYARLSAAAPAAWQRLQIPTKWHALIDGWLGL